MSRIAGKVHENGETWLFLSWTRKSSGLLCHIYTSPQGAIHAESVLKMQVIIYLKTAAASLMKQFLTTGRGREKKNPNLLAINVISHYFCNFLLYPSGGRIIQPTFISFEVNNLAKILHSAGRTYVFLWALGFLKNLISRTAVLTVRRGGRWKSQELAGRD